MSNRPRRTVSFRPRTSLRRKVRDNNNPLNPGVSRGGLTGLLQAVGGSRRNLGALLGQSFDGERDLYTELGYPKNLTYDKLYGLYSRQDICNRIINSFPNATWRGEPEIHTTKSEGSKVDAFSKAWGDLARKLRVFHYFNRVDKLSGIGQYSILLVGFDDGGELDTPVVKAKSVLYLAPYSQANAKVKKLELDKTSPRCGLPLEYEITTARAIEGVEGQNSLVGNRRVHHSRVLHVAENLLEDEIYGVPRLGPIFNRLEDLARLAGGSAEMFWKGAFPGIGISAREGGNWNNQSITELTDELTEYFHGMKRFLRLTNVDITRLDAQVASPEAHAELQLKLIAGASGIPVRILTGSERGELSSGQDENNWNARIAERRVDFAEMVLIRPFVSMLGAVGVLDVPESFECDWPDIQALSEKDQADIGLVKTKSISEYVKSGGESLIPPLDFLTGVLGMEENEARRAIEEVVDAIEGEEELAIGDGGEEEL